MVTRLPLKGGGMFGLWGEFAQIAAVLRRLAWVEVADQVRTDLIVGFNCLRGLCH